MFACVYKQGITTTMKRLVSFSDNDINKLKNAGWGEGGDFTNANTCFSA